MLHDEDSLPARTSPSWAILLHRAPSHSDESPLLANNLLTVSKLGHKPETDIFSQNTIQSRTRYKSMRDIGQLYYRPNSTHQFLSATDLRGCAEDQVNLNFGRPTRTSLLRTLQRRNSAGANSYHTRRDFLHRLQDLRNSNETNPITEYFKSGKAPDGEPLHSFLTGARYNRCRLLCEDCGNELVFSCRYNPELGCCFTEIKADETPCLATRTHKQRTLLTSTYLLRPSTTPGQDSRNRASCDSPVTGSDSQTTPLKLKVTGNNPSLNSAKVHGFKLPNLQTDLRTGKHSRRPKRDSSGMFSSRTNSARADSDIQEMSDSIKNAIIASTGETDPVCLETAEKAGSRDTDLDRIGRDTPEDNVLDNLLTGSSERMSSTSLHVISLPSDKAASLRQDGDNQVVDGGEMTQQEDGFDQHNQRDNTDGNTLGTDSIDSKEDEYDPVKNNNDFLDNVDYTTHTDKSVCADDEGISVSSERNDTFNDVLENNENYSSLTAKTHFDQDWSECPREAGEVIREDQDDSSEAADEHEETDAVTLVPEDESVAFFITEENIEDGENLEEGNLEA